MNGLPLELRLISRTLSDTFCNLLKTVLFWPCLWVVFLKRRYINVWMNEWITLMNFIGPALGYARPISSLCVSYWIFLFHIYWTRCGICLGPFLSVVCFPIFLDFPLRFWPNSAWISLFTLTYLFTVTLNWCVEHLNCDYAVVHRLYWTSGKPLRVVPPFQQVQDSNTKQKSVIY